MVARKTSRTRRGMTAEKARQLLSGRDYFGDAYGSDDSAHDTTFDEESARHDWAATRNFLTREFEKYNPGKVCFASARFDGVPIPADQTHRFSRFKLSDILNLFPVGA